MELQAIAAVILGGTSIYGGSGAVWRSIAGVMLLALINNGFNIFADENTSFAGGFEHQGYFALIDKDGYIRSRKDSFGNPIMYYLGITDINANLQGIEMLSYDIKKLIDE